MKKHQFSFVAKVNVQIRVANGSYELKAVIELNYPRLSADRSLPSVKFD
jgi:hypothetical protein